jgi:hypothetical protein
MVRIAYEKLYQECGGKGMTAATLSDFAQYDTGRKFP